MFLLHLVLGLLLLTPFVIFAFFHLRATRKRRNRRAVRVGYALLWICLILLVTGILLTRISGLIELREPLARKITYWAHVLTPLLAIWLYWLHRLAGPPIKWRVGAGYAAIVAVVVGAMVFLQAQDPRQWHVKGPSSPEYFEPALTRTSDGNFIPEHVLMNDKYCLECHQDIYEDWSHSVHRFSSFNNPAYLATIVEVRDVLLERDGDVKASRFCAGCHDVVPFLSGKFDDPNFDFHNDESASAGITCTVCHAITQYNSTRGNGDFTIEQPVHYPFTYSKQPFLQWLNHQLVKAKPSFHKREMLKPIHKTAEFCATCHKVNLPGAVTHYKEFLRGQNFYDSYLLSGVSGHGLRSFYYPAAAETNCNECHMPRKASNDFGAQNYGAGLEVHDHLFPSANTAVAWWRDEPEVVERHIAFNEGVMRVDIFGVKPGDNVQEEVIGPLRPDVPKLKRGETYLLETIIRTLKMGHHFTQGTADSNEVWMSVKVIENARYDESGELLEGRVIGRSGGLDASGSVDPWSHFVNVFMLDREGNRINRRNAQDIFVPLYNHQIPPGAAQVVHYQLDVPSDARETITVEVELKYRKFDAEYVDYIARFMQQEGLPLRGHTPGEASVNRLPVMVLARDKVTFAIDGAGQVPENLTPDIPVWQRWNDYGIGLLLEGSNGGGKGELRQAQHAFEQVSRAGSFHGPLNLARAYNAEGNLEAAVESLQQLTEYQNEKDFPAWTVAWLTGVINKQQGHLDQAIENLTNAINFETSETRERNFDFSKDYVVLNELGLTIFERAKQLRGPTRLEQRRDKLSEARAWFEKVVEIDVENVTAHYTLAQIYRQLGNPEKAGFHQQKYEIYKLDDNARDRAVSLAREKYPAADHAAEPLVIYQLDRPGAPELPEK